MLFEPKEFLLDQNFELLCLDFAFKGPFSALSSILRGNFTSSKFVLKKIFEEIFLKNKNSIQLLLSDAKICAEA
jgi:hypothetical protein